MLAELAELYLEKHAKVLKRSWREDERTINRELLPRWKNWKAIEIKRKHVIAMLDEIAGRGSGIMANRTRALASKIFNFGIQRGVVEYNPVHNVPIPGEEQRRDRVLTEEEIRQVWTALDHERLPIAATLKLALLTAQRRSEVLGMRWMSSISTHAGGLSRLSARRTSCRIGCRSLRKPSIFSEDSGDSPTGRRTFSQAPRRSPLRTYRSRCSAFVSERGSSFASTIFAARRRAT
jgi:hypothetical protein